MVDILVDRIIKINSNKEIVSYYFCQVLLKVCRYLKRVGYDVVFSQFSNQNSEDF